MSSTETIPLPSSKGGSLDKAGIQPSGYINKKGTPSGESAMFNKLPPGQDITDQSVCDIREQPMKDLVDHTGFDGWK